MLILIAESKTMNISQSTIENDILECHQPLFEHQANQIVSWLNSLSLQELASVIGISLSLAQKTKKLLYEFPFKHTGETAMSAFTGEVFKALDYNSLDQEAKEYLSARIRIISSLYGLLFPADIIKPYRLDYNKNCAPEGKSLINFWKQILTIALVKNLKENGVNEILNLLPGDADKFLDWKVIKAFANVVKIDFKIFNSHGLKTPHAGLLKALRGNFIRMLAINQVASIKDIFTIQNDNFIYSPENSKPDYPMFISTELSV